MLEKSPPWLPDIVSVSGQWEQVLKRLYRIFERDFVHGNCRFQGMPVWWDRRRVDGDEYEEGFWHLITKTDHYSGDRLLDSRRAERLPWCNPTLTNCDEPEVKVWEYRESSGKVRTYVWLENWDYVIILELKRRDWGKIAFLITAYHVDYNSTRRNLDRKYLRREIP